jgi:hypothetical protein
VIKDERRHFAFYRAQARVRLARGPQARRLTRWAMEHLWAPVGTGVRPQAETDFVVAWLFAGDEGRAALDEMDATIRDLPGLERTRLARTAAQAAFRRRGGVGPESGSGEQAAGGANGQPRGDGNGRHKADAADQRPDDLDRHDLTVRDLR